MVVVVKGFMACCFAPLWARSLRWRSNFGYITLMRGNEICSSLLQCRSCLPFFDLGVLPQRRGLALDYIGST